MKHSNEKCLKCGVSRSTLSSVTVVNGCVHEFGEKESIDEQIDKLLDGPSNPHHSKPPTGWDEPFWEREFDEKFFTTSPEVKIFIRQVEQGAVERTEKAYREHGSLTRSEAVRLRASVAEVERDRIVGILENMTRVCSSHPDSYTREACGVVLSNTLARIRNQKG